MSDQAERIAVCTYCKDTDGWVCEEHPFTPCSCDPIMPCRERHWVPFGDLLPVDTSWLPKRQRPSWSRK